MKKVIALVLFSLIFTSCGLNHIKLDEKPDMDWKTKKIENDQNETETE